MTGCDTKYCNYYDSINYYLLSIFQFFYSFIKYFYKVKSINWVLIIITRRNTLTRIVLIRNEKILNNKIILKK